MAECAPHAVAGCGLADASHATNINVISDDELDAHGGVSFAVGGVNGELRDGLPCAFDGLPYLPVTPVEATGLAGSGRSELCGEGTILFESRFGGPWGPDVWSSLGLSGTTCDTRLCLPPHGAQSCTPQGLGSTPLPGPFQPWLQPGQAIMPSLPLQTAELFGQPTVPATRGGLNHSASMLTPDLERELATPGCNGKPQFEPMAADLEVSPDRGVATWSAWPSAAPTAAAPGVSWGEATVGLGVIRAQHVPPWVVQVKGLGRVCAWQVPEPGVT